MPITDYGVGATKVYFNAALDATDKQVVTGESLLYTIHCMNTTGAAAYLQIYDGLIATFVPGTTTPTMSFGMAANASVTVHFQKPIKFGTGICVASTTAVAGGTGAETVTVIAYA